MTTSSCLRTWMLAYTHIDFKPPNGLVTAAWIDDQLSRPMAACQPTRAATPSPPANFPPL